MRFAVLIHLKSCGGVSNVAIHRKCGGLRRSEYFAKERIAESREVARLSSLKGESFSSFFSHFLSCFFSLPCTIFEAQHKSGLRRNVEIVGIRYDIKATTLPTISELADFPDGRSRYKRLVRDYAQLLFFPLFGSFNPALRNSFRCE